MRMLSASAFKAGGHLDRRAPELAGTQCCKQPPARSNHKELSADLMVDNSFHSTPQVAVPTAALRQLRTSAQLQACPEPPRGLPLAARAATVQTPAQHRQSRPPFNEQNSNFYTSVCASHLQRDLVARLRLCCHNSHASILSCEHLRSARGQRVCVCNGGREHIRRIP